LEALAKVVDGRGADFACISTQETIFSAVFDVSKDIDGLAPVLEDPCGFPVRFGCPRVALIRLDAKINAASACVTFA